MKESVLDVLMYLYENYSDSEFADTGRHADLEEELIGAGFPEEEVRHAFQWLNGLADTRLQSLAPRASAHVLRIYANSEMARIPTECRGFLHYLEQLGILSADSRELAIDRLMALDDDVDLEQLKWVLLLVLMNQPGQEDAYAKLEGLVYSDGDFLH